MSFGLDPDAFWTKTPRQILLILAGKNDQRIHEHNERAWLAHQTAVLVQVALTNPKRFPKLERMLHASPRARMQTPEQILGIVKILNAAFGGRVIESKAKH